MFSSSFFMYFCKKSDNNKIMATNITNLNISDQKLTEWYNYIDTSNNNNAKLYASYIQGCAMPLLEISACNEFPKQLTNKYGTIILSDNVFCSIPNVDDAQKFLDFMHKMLNNDGMLLVEVRFPWQRIKSANTSAWQSGCDVENNEGENFIYSYRDVVDFAEQTITTHSRYEIIKDGNLQGLRYDTVAWRWYGIRELKSMLLAVGFNNITTKKITEPDSDSFTILFICR